MRSFVKIKPSRNGKITLSFIDIGKSCLSREFFHITNMSFNAISKIKFSRKFPNLQSIFLFMYMLGQASDSMTTLKLSLLVSSLIFSLADPHPHVAQLSHDM